MDYPIRTLILADEQEAGRLAKTLNRNGVLVRHYCIEGLLTSREALKKDQWDIVLCRLEPGRPCDLTELVGDPETSPPFILIGPVDDPLVSATCIQAGIADWVEANDTKGLVRAVRRTLRQTEALQESRAARKKLDEASALLKSVVNSTPDLISIRDQNEVFLACNAAFGESLGLTEDEIVGRTTEETLPRARANLRKKKGKNVLARGALQRFEEEVTYPNGRRVLMDTLLCPYRGSESEVLGVIGVSRDITERKALEDTWRKFEFIVNTARDAMSLISRDYVFEAVNDVYCANSNKTSENIVGRSVPQVWGDTIFQEKIKPNLDKCFKGKEVRYEAWFQFHQQDPGFYQVVYYPYLNDQGEATHAVVISRDITDHKRLEEALTHQAFHDSLTGLPNRTLLLDRIRQALRKASRAGHLMGLFLLDLDDFKHINDSFGHQLGDELLIKAAQRLTSNSREADTIARLGGDEFMVLIEDAASIDALTRMAEGLLDHFTEPFRVKGKELHMGVSVGLAVFPMDGADPESLMKNADLAMYKAKEKGKNTYSLYTRDMNDQVLKRLTMEGDLRRALSRNEFSLRYQPKVDAATGRLTGMETLLRWNSPSGGMIPPDEFIPVAEDSGLIIQMDHWVLEQACRQAQLWREMGYKDLHLAVNLSARHLHLGNLPEVVESILDKVGYPPDRLELEVTETALMKNLDTSLILLRQLNELGVRLAMDDFGTGYSSLYYLKSLPIQTLKIDKSFVDDLGMGNGDAEVLVRTMLSLASNLGLEVVAEGVETMEQYQFLKEHDCRYIQGYLFSKPLLQGEFEALLGKEPPFPSVPPADGAH
jgi:diguanylate cyclase (GGDEF)-like protein/PAS domain S-box-containing protein